MDARPVSAAEASKLLDFLGSYPHLAIAVSGGADSLALLLLVSRWRAERGSKPDVTVLTVDHGLRAQSREEAEMVADVAARLGLSHAILAWNGAKHGETGLQARARAGRYDLMAAFCHAHGIPALLTAHHLDDQAETFLMRLKRGSGLDGLAAIPDASIWAGIAVHRPLLDLAKARLTATLTESGLGWAEDPSNQDRRFERSRVRADRDALAQLGLPPEALARSAKRLRRARAALERGTDEFLAKHATVGEAGFCTIAAKALAEAPEEIALRALARVLGSVGGRPEPVRLAKLEALLAALSARPNRAHTLGGCRIAPHGEGFGVFREARRAGLPELELKPGERALWDNRFSVELAKSESAPAIVRALGSASIEGQDPAPWLQALPRFARIALPVCARGGVLILPSLSPAKGSASAFRANFVGGRGVSTTPSAR
jgi:tRNA(Ile)-lysidine synthase